MHALTDNIVYVYCYICDMQNVLLCHQIVLDINIISI